MKGMIAIILLILTSTLISQTATAPINGNGSEESPYEIASLENLYWISENPDHWVYHYKQTNDIDASDTINWFDGYGWYPIGNSTRFTGSYDGQNFTIDSLYINRPETIRIGLFGAISDAVISNVRLTSLDITGREMVGALAGVITERSFITNCHASGEVTASRHLAGGLIGLSEGNSEIRCCSGNCEVTGSAVVSFVGGLVGSQGEESCIEECWCRGSVTGQNYTAGFIGRNYQDSAISNCYSACSVTGRSIVGGFVGLVENASISDSYSYGPVSVAFVGGGFAGSSEGECTRCYWNIETSNQSTSCAGEGRTIDEMTFPYAANTYVDWDFTTIWHADSLLIQNAGYPYLFRAFSAEPMPPENIEIAVVEGDAHITWDAVTEDLIGNSASPDYYIVYYSESNNQGGDYYVLGFTAATNYTHENVGLTESSMFYRVEAVVLSADELQRFSQLRPGMSETRVREILRGE